MISCNYYFIKRVYNKLYKLYNKLRKNDTRKNDKNIYLKINFSYYFIMN